MEAGELNLPEVPAQINDSVHGFSFSMMGALSTATVQVDTHINNQYNTCYWALRQQAGKTPSEAQEVLKGTLADFKNEMLFMQFGINYNDLPARFRKGSVIIRCKQLVSGSASEGTEKWRNVPTVMHVDIIKDEFWQQHPELLA
jgi:tRNA(His) guanylyltransferase